LTHRRNGYFCKLANVRFLDVAGPRRRAAGFIEDPTFDDAINVDGAPLTLGCLSGTSFLANLADAAGDYHAIYMTNFADFSVGAPPAATAAGSPPRVQLT
jgi:hypothetical protein